MPARDPGQAIEHVAHVEDVQQRRQQAGRALEAALVLRHLLRRASCVQEQRTRLRDGLQPDQLIDTERRRSGESGPESRRRIDAGDGDRHDALDASEEQQPFDGAGRVGPQRGGVGLPYAAGNSLNEKRWLQQISVGFSAQVNALRSQGALVIDLMCDGAFYQPGMYSGDGFHPNDAGYARLADLVYGAASTGSATPPRSSCPQMSLF